MTIPINMTRHYGKQVPLSVFLFLAIATLASCGSAEEASKTVKTKEAPVSSRPVLPTLPAIFSDTKSGITQEVYAKALKGDHQAQYEVGSVSRYLEPPMDRYEHMTVEDKKAFYGQRNKIAFDFVARSASRGNFQAQEELAAMYETGFGTEASFKSAKKWFDIALKTAKLSKKQDDIDEAKSNLESFAADMKNSAEADKEQADQDRVINQRLSQFTDSFRMRDLIGRQVTLGIPDGNIKRLWAAKTLASDLDFFTAYTNNDQVGMQSLLDSGNVVDLPINTKALITAYDRSSDQVHVHIQSGRAIGQDLLVMYNFVKP